MFTLGVVTAGGVLWFLFNLPTGNQGRIVFLGIPTGPSQGVPRINRLYSIKPDGDNLTQLTEGIFSVMQYHNTWSSAGKTLAYMEPNTQTGGEWLSVADSDGRNRRKVLDATNLRLGSMAISPDAKKILLSLDSTRLIQTPVGNTVHVEEAHDTDLATVDVKTGELKKLTDTMDVAEWLPSYSPDGKMVAFTGRDAGETNTSINDVYVMDSDGSDRRLIAKHIPGFMFYQPELLWSPDSRKIAFVRYNMSISDSEHYMDIFVLDVKTEVLTNLTNSLYVIDANPEWSPDSRKVVYYSGNVTNGFGTIVMDINTGNLTMLDQGQSSWTPDGKRLIFVNSANVSEIMIDDADGKNPRSLAVIKDTRVSNPLWLVP